MKIIQLQQNTPEWDELRRSKLGASDIAILMAGTPAEVNELYLSKTIGKKKFQTEAMRRGSEMEREARMWVNLRNDMDFEPLVAVSDDQDWLMSSFDGWDQYRNMSLEIKCPLKVMDPIESHPSYEKWWWQVQTHYAVGGHSDSFLVSYSPEKQVVSNVSRSDEAIAKLIEKGKEFREKILNYEGVATDLPEKTDDAVLQAANEWREANESLRLATLEEERLRQRLIELGNGSPYQAGGVSVTKYYRRGAIEYKQIIELRNVDLEKYRKGGIEVWKVS